MTFYQFCDKNKDNFKNSRWSVKQAAYVKYMKGQKKDE